MQRREFIKLAGVAAAGGVVGGLIVRGKQEPEPEFVSKRTIVSKIITLVYLPAVITQDIRPGIVFGDPATSVVHEACWIRREGGFDAVLDGEIIRRLDPVTHEVLDPTAYVVSGEQGRDEYGNRILVCEPVSEEKWAEIKDAPIQI